MPSKEHLCVLSVHWDNEFGENVVEKWYLTDEGKKAYSKFVDPDEFRRESSRLYYQWRDKQPKEANEAVEEFQAEIGTSERVADASSTVEEAEETAWKEIEEYIQAINPYDLQRLSESCHACCEL